MKNKAEGISMMELQRIMRDRVVISLKEDLTPEQRQTEYETSKLIERMACQMINNGRFILDTEKMLAQRRDLKESKAYQLIGE